MTPLAAARVRDRAARALLLLAAGGPAPGSLAHLTPRVELEAAARKLRDDERRAARAEDRRCLAALAEADLEVARMLADLRPHPVAGSGERIARWAKTLSSFGSSPGAAAGGSPSLAAALSPSCEAEARIALAIAGAPCADGFDLAEHLRRVGAVVRRSS